jgi:N-acetylglucosaminyl-diphospho-decaprenol L-rhamnosyltransferase
MAAPAGAEAPHLPTPRSAQPRHDVCTIVVSHNSGDWLGPALSSLFGHAGGLELDVVVVDNGDDGSGREAAERFDGVRTIECANHGFAHANNRGAITADARYLLLLNPDVEVLVGELADLVAHMDAHPEIGIAGCRQVDGEGGLWPTARRFPGVARALGEAIGPERLGLGARLGETELDLARYDGELSCDWISGSFLLIRREALARTGLLDERFFFYSEEVDLCLRVKRAGWEVRHLPQFTIAHYGGSTEASPRMEAQMAYARSQYAAKHFGPLRRVAFVGLIGLRHLTRWVAFSVRGEPGRAAAHRRALLTLLGRVEPPFGPPRSAG